MLAEHVYKKNKKICILNVGVNVIYYDYEDIGNPLTLEADEFYISEFLINTQLHYKKEK